MPRECTKSSLGHGAEQQPTIWLILAMPHPLNSFTGFLTPIYAGTTFISCH